MSIRDEVHHRNKNNLLLKLCRLEEKRRVIGGSRKVANGAVNIVSTASCTKEPQSGETLRMFSIQKRKMAVGIQFECLLIRAVAPGGNKDTRLMSLL